MHLNHHRGITLAMLAIALLFSACLGGPSQAPATRFFVLNSLYSEEYANRPDPVMS